MWPAVRQPASAGEQPFPVRAGKKVLAELRGIAELKGWRGAGRLGTHSSRRGAARAILEAGGSLSQLLRAGHWRASAHQLYLDLGHEEARALAAITVEASDDE